MATRKAAPYDPQPPLLEFVQGATDQQIIERLGPQGAVVFGMIEQVHQLGLVNAFLMSRKWKLAADRRNGGSHGSGSPWDTAWTIANRPERRGQLALAWMLGRRAAGASAAHWGPAMWWLVAWEAIVAVLVQDELPTEAFDALHGPWKGCQ